MNLFFKKLEQEINSLSDSEFKWYHKFWIEDLKRKKDRGKALLIDYNKGIIKSTKVKIVVNDYLLLKKNKYQWIKEI